MRTPTDTIPAFTVSRPAVRLLQRVKARILANPKLADQRNWCGTAYCIAGHVVAAKYPSARPALNAAGFYVFQTRRRASIHPENEASKALGVPRGSTAWRELVGVSSMAATAPELRLLPRGGTKTMARLMARHIDRWLKKYAGVAALLLLLLLPAVARAQTGPCPTTPISPAINTNPQWICLPLPPEHTLTDPATGQPLIDHYDLLWIANGANPATATPLRRDTIGKPVGNADNAAWLQFSSLPPITPGVTYQIVPASISTLASIPVADREVRALTGSDPFGLPRTAKIPAQPPARVR